MSINGPVLLGGPMLRRASVEGVYVWLAFDGEIQGINAEVYKLDGTRREVVGQADAESLSPLRLGTHLYIYLIKLLSHRGVFEHDQLYFYEVVQNSSQGSQGFFEKEGRALAYAGAPIDLPSFFLPQQHTHILQASCRKPHAATTSGKAVIDQFAALDEIVAASIMDATQRPSQLFLTGDQIYADDVALPLQRLCSKLGRELTGKSELLPSVSGKQKPVDPYAADLKDRRVCCNRETGFTSGFAQHHLMSFAEYVAMYLLVSGGVPIERRMMETFEQAKSHTVYTGMEKIKKYLIPRFARGKYEVELSVVGEFLRQAKYYRRVLANVPTYMMIDDHDVTDDWNLTRENADRVRDIPFSRRIITNALSAAWVFQLWGNDPERFGLFKNQVSSAHAHGSDESMAWLEEHFIFKRFWWGAAIPSSPPALLLDTRTRRAHAGDKLSLMDTPAFTEARALLADINVNNSLLLLSPAPVFGFSLVEALQLKFDKKAATTIDREPWVANLDALRVLKDFCMSPETIRHVLILSGDVHYGFHRYENYRHLKSVDRVHFWQLTSSSVCNIPPGKSVGQTVVAKWLPAMGRYFSRWRLRAHRKEKARYLLPANSDEFITAGTNINLLVLDQRGTPVSSWLYCADATTGKKLIWQYDLRAPRILEL